MMSFLHQIAFMNQKVFDSIIISFVDFDDILATFSFLLQQNKNSVIYTTYQERNEHRNIEFLLLKWGLSASEVPLSQFMDADIFKTMFSLQEKKDLDNFYNYCLNSIKLFQIKAI